MLKKSKNINCVYYRWFNSINWYSCFLNKIHNLKEITQLGKICNCGYKWGEKYHMDLSELSKYWWVE